MTTFKFELAVNMLLQSANYAHITKQHDTTKHIINTVVNSHMTSVEQCLPHQELQIHLKIFIPNIHYL